VVLHQLGGKEEEDGKRTVLCAAGGPLIKYHFSTAEEKKEGRYAAVRNWSRSIPVTMEKEKGEGKWVCGETGRRDRAHDLGLRMRIRQMHFAVKKEGRASHKTRYMEQGRGALDCCSVLNDPLLWEGKKRFLHVLPPGKQKGKKRIGDLRSRVGDLSDPIKKKVVPDHCHRLRAQREKKGEKEEREGGCEREGVHHFPAEVLLGPGGERRSMTFSRNKSRSASPLAKEKKEEDVRANSTAILGGKCQQRRTSLLFVLRWKGKERPEQLVASLLPGLLIGEKKKGEKGEKSRKFRIIINYQSTDPRRVKKREAKGMPTSRHFNQLREPGKKRGEREREHLAMS